MRIRGEGDHNDMEAHANAGGQTETQEFPFTGGIGGREIAAITDGTFMKRIRNFWRFIMTIEQQVTQILSLVTAQTTAINNLATAVSAIPTAPGGTPVDNTAVLAAIASLDAKVTDVQSQLESPATPPAPAPDTAPTPAPDAAPTSNT
jgi:hypothetical protein